MRCVLLCECHSIPKRDRSSECDVCCYANVTVYRGVIVQVNAMCVAMRGLVISLKAMLVVQRTLPFVNN